MSFADHFSAVARRYAAYRPHYPRALIDALVDASPAPRVTDRCTSESAPTCGGLAWEAGAGSGQLSVALGERFARVIATEPSQAQLDAAPAHPHVEYRCEPAEACSLPDGCADLAVAAQAAHWFDWPRYVAEVARVARPGALVALVSYGILDLDGDAGALVASYYRDLAPYWPPERRHVENGYRELAWPWPELAAPAIAMAEHWTRDELTGYVATWSATSALVKAGGGGRYDELCTALARGWPDGERREIRWPLALRFARR